MRGVIVGQVVRVRDHPNGDLIWLADVDLGDGELPVQIVFGGLRGVVQPDSLVPVAPPGSRVPDPDNPGVKIKMRRRSYRGESSYGMLCSLAELGWDLTVGDQVAIFKEHSMKPGTSLDEVGDDWRSLVLPTVPAGPAEFQAGPPERVELQLGRYELPVTQLTPATPPSTRWSAERVDVSPTPKDPSASPDGALTAASA